MNSRKEKLLNVARSTKDALYAQWKKSENEGYFDDHSNFTGKKGMGLMSEAIGLTSVLLMYIRFVEDKDVFESGKNDFETTKIITTSFNYIYKQITDSGYTVTPYLNVEQTEYLFDKKRSYVDTLTWVLSLSSLMVYADSQKLISLDQNLIENAKELLGDSLTRIIDGQLDCGAWGFSTDKNCKPSLYSTYAVATSMADFFDYIMGELEYYGNEEKQKMPLEEFYLQYSQCVIKDIKPVYERNHPNRDLVADIIEVRSKLQIWLLKNCLPLLPKLASCVPMEAKERELMGYPKQNNNVIIDGKDYLNLYYAYYIIDILITTSSDKRYKDIIRGKDKAVSLKDLSNSYIGVISDTDFAYFFMDKKNNEKAFSFYDEYTNLAIQSSRASFSNAMRTGEDFWDGKMSELDILWEHNDIPPQFIGKIRGRAKIKEPTLIPMALRANAVFCYYILERTDVTVDNLFDIICDNRSVESKTVVSEDNETNTQVANLWDNISYSLIVTERSIEAMVDYYDYLEKTVQETEKAILSDETLSLDDVINKKIAAFLKSEEGEELLGELGYVHKNNDCENSAIDFDSIALVVDEKINEAINTRLSKIIERQVQTSVQSNNAPRSFEDVNVDAIIRLLENLQIYMNNNYNHIPERNGETAEKLTYALLGTFASFKKIQLYKYIIEYETDESKISKKYDKLSSQIDNLIENVVKFCDGPEGNISEIYCDHALKGRNI